MLTVHAQDSVLQIGNVTRTSWGKKGESYPETAGSKRIQLSIRYSNFKTPTGTVFTLDFARITKHLCLEHKYIDLSPVSFWLPLPYVV